MCGKFNSESGSEFLLCAFLSLLLTLLTVSGHAEEGLSVDKELDRPGVRLVAVEFYATWCKPCMEAVPKWKALHDKYRDKGLRLIVVAVQDDGRCTNPGWSPDRVICDEDGRISAAVHVGQNLPSAFLWNWRGKLLVQRGHVAEVEKAVAAELDTAPRVTIGAVPAGPDAVQLRKLSELVRAEVRKSGKLEVVATADERDMLDRVRRESQKAGYSENSQCKLGAELAANSLLKVSLQGSGKGTKLLLQLFSAESGCLLQSGLAPWRPNNDDLAVAEAVADLIGRLRSDTEMPMTSAPAAKAPFASSKFETAKEVETENLEEIVVGFTSTPPASVHLGDKMLCKSTPCSKAVPLGRQTVTMSAEDYQTRSETLQVAKGMRTVDWSLRADFATLNLTCGDQPVSVRLDGQAMGTCPISGAHLRAGKHSVALDSPCHLGAEKLFEAKVGNAVNLDLPATARLGVVTVKARNDGGDDLNGTALLDGKALGMVPGSFKAPVCGRTLEVRSEGHVRWSAPLAVKEGAVTHVVAELQRQAASRPSQAPPRLPALAAAHARDEVHAVLRPTAGSSVRGSVAFFEDDQGKVTVTGTVEGLTAGQAHALIVHEFGDCSAPDGASAGGHFNPEGNEHGLPAKKARHAGDLGNITADGSGKAEFAVVVDNLTVAKWHGVAGRSVVVHDKADDGGQPTGNSGSRLACGVIGVAKAPEATK